MSDAAHAQLTAELDAALAALQLEGHWKTNQDALPAEPGSTVEPYLWRWAELYPQLLKAGELLSNEAGASRRTLRLCTPGLPLKATTRTIHTSVQMVKPGEVARMHRHTIGAFRFVIGGSGGVTAVDGQRFVMERFDLVLTPQWTWHEHSNETAEPMIWIDGHDMPLMRAFDTIFFQSSKAHNGEPASGVEPGGLPRQAAPHIYRGEESLAALRALGSEAWNPFQGRVLDYRNRQTGGATLPTIQCRLQALDAGEATRRRRHTASTVYYVVEGSGTTYAGDKALAWRPGDMFVVPNWAWHHHHAGTQGPVTLFSASDEPILAAFGHLRQEADSAANGSSLGSGVSRHG